MKARQVERIRGVRCVACRKEVSITVDADDAIPMVDQWLDEAADKHRGECAGTFARFDSGVGE